MNGMRLIKDEFIKLKRCNILWVGIITLLCSPLLSVLQQESLNAPIPDYGYANLVNGVIWNKWAFSFRYTDAAGRLHDKPGIHGRYAERNIYDPHFLQEIDAGENRRFAYIIYSLQLL